MRRQGKSNKSTRSHDGKKETKPIQGMIVDLRSRTQVRVFDPRQKLPQVRERELNCHVLPCP
jgi:hypothetical protein